MATPKRQAVSHERLNPGLAEESSRKSGLPNGARSAD